MAIYLLKIPRPQLNLLKNKKKQNIQFCQNVNWKCLKKNCAQLNI